MESKILKLAVAVIGMAAFGAFGDIVPTTLREMYDTNTLYTASQVDQKIAEETGEGASTNYVNEATQAVYRAAVDYADAGLANKASKSDVDPLLFAQNYPDGSVKSAAEFTLNIKYTLTSNATGRTAMVKPFCNTGTATNDNSSLVGRVVIPPFVDDDGNGYISDDGTRFEVVGVGSSSVFYDNTRLVAVIVSRTVATIGGYAFRDCTALTSVSLPAVQTVGDQAFARCSSLTAISLPAATNIGDYVFTDCASLTSVSLPAAQTVGNAFWGCGALTSVSLPAATNIGDNAFSSCAVLTSVVLSAATNIGNAFRDCTALTSVVLPAATSFGNSTFFGCTSLASVDFGDMPRPSVPNFVPIAFDGVPTSCKLIVPDGQYDEWTAKRGWSALVTAGYKFLKHSEWEYARRYELEDRVSKTDFNTATNKINTALRSDTLLTPVYSTYNLTIPNTLDDEDMSYSNEVSLVYDDSQGKYALAIGGTRASNYLTSGDDGHTLLYNGGIARAEQLFDLTNGSVVAEQEVLGYVLGSQADKPLASDAALLSSSTGISRFSEATTYAVDSLVFHAGDVWVCSTKHNAGPWNSAHFTRTDVLVNKARNPGSNVAVGNSKISNSNNSVAIGSGSVTANSCVAVGYGASVSGYSAVQLGAGANSTPKSLQFRRHQIAVESTVDGRVVCRLNRNLLDLVEPISWTNLVERRNQGRLLPGMEYRITNYVATTSGDMDSQSANHPFDIIVVADSITNLNEHARAVRSDGDTYFAGCNLAAWDVWYCIDNDTSRFAWAVANGGKGVIYRLVDEFQNDVPYDFKGIQFKAYGDTDNVWRYTFDSGDASGNVDLSKSGLENWVFKNAIGQCGGVRWELNCIVFKGSFCYSNTFGSGCRYNTFGNGCYDNTFGAFCNSNTFGAECCLNTFGSNCFHIKFGNASATKSYCRYIRIASGNRFLYINPTGNTTASAYYQNVEIAEGVNNTTTYKTIDDPNVNQNFKTTYQPAASQVISIP